MQTRTIPTDVYPWWECTINNKKYRYRSGETVSVPDAVAELIDSINRQERYPEPLYPPVLPVITDAAEGKILKVIGGRLSYQPDKGAESRIFEVEAVVSQDEEENQYITLDKTALECYEAAVSGKTLHVHTEVGEMQVEIYLPVEATVMTENGTTLYRVRARADTTENDALFESEYVSADTIVVLKRM